MALFETSPPIADCTLNASWLPYLNFVLVQVAAVLSAIALWVGAHARSISRAARRTSSEALQHSDAALSSQERRGSARGAQDRRKR